MTRSIASTARKLHKVLPSGGHTTHRRQIGSEYWELLDAIAAKQETSSSRIVTMLIEQFVLLNVQSTGELELRSDVR